MMLVRLGRGLRPLIRALRVLRGPILLAEDRGVLAAEDNRILIRE
ncbi:hypothetical protein [Roseomonas genomospecies 6]|nr:hypothetical protein [Roseomonas genomospecies 6]